MRKQLFLLMVFLAGLNSACSSKNSTDDLASIPNSTAQSSPAKPSKSHRHSLPDGVISVDLFADNGHLHLLTGQHHQGNKSLWYQVSGDGGKSWSKPIKILGQDLAFNADRGKDAQITAQGNTIVVTWMKFDAEARFNAGPMQAARSIDGGKTWQLAAAPPDWQQGPHGYFDLAADNLAMHAVWLDSRNGPSGIKATQALHYAKSVDGGLSWQANLTLDEITCSCCWNTIKSDIDGNAYVLYRDKQPSDMSLGLVNRDQEWQRLSHVGAFDWQFEGCPHIGGGIDFQYHEGNKRIHAVVGTGHPDHLGVHYLHSDNGGASWSTPLPLGDESAVHADIAVQNDGHTVAVWDMLGENGLAIFSAQSLDGGLSWTQPKQISKPGLRASHPRISKTANGFLVLWTENDGHQQTLAKLRL